jgi:hypothetical protein
MVIESRVAAVSCCSALLPAAEHDLSDLLPCVRCLLLLLWPAAAAERELLPAAAPDDAVCEHTCLDAGAAVLAPGCLPTDLPSPSSSV